MIDLRSVSKGLELRDDGIWYSKDREKLSYPSDGNDTCFAIEDSSFWFQHRNQCIASLAASFPPPHNGTIFDVGGGNGFVALGLEQAGFSVALLEPGERGAFHAKQRGLTHVVCSTLKAAQFRSHSLPAVGIFDVLEHIQDAQSFLLSIKEALRQDGLLYLTVPAYPALWSAEDELAGHFRRYTLKTLNRALNDAGFEVEFATYIFRFLPLPIFLMRTLPYWLGFAAKKLDKETTARDHTAPRGSTQTLLDFLLRAEVENLDRKAPMAFGGSCLVAAKPASTRSIS